MWVSGCFDGAEEASEAEAVNEEEPELVPSQSTITKSFAFAQPKQYHINIKIPILAKAKGRLAHPHAHVGKRESLCL